MNLWTTLQGKKTYLVAAALSLLAVVWNLDLSFHDNPATTEMELGWMKETTYGTIRMLLEGGGLAALRMAFFSTKTA